MIQAKRLGHVVLNVRNAEKSRDFYTQTIGLKVNPLLPSWAWAILAALAALGGWLMEGRRINRGAK